MNEETRTFYLEKLKEEKDAINRLIKAYKRESKHISEHKSAEIFDRDYNDLKELKDDEVERLRSLIDSINNPFCNHEMKCEHEYVMEVDPGIFKQSENQKMYKCLDCGLYVELSSQKEVESFLNSRRIIPNILSFRYYYLKQLLTMPSNEALEKTLTYRDKNNS